ncbi:MAG TPA: site-2 protease family protein [Acidimicrobiales bacterium]|nr:site-2 protease family protein [Acidimicrobiales bacterium]
MSATSDAPPRARESIAPPPLPPTPPMDGWGGGNGEGGMPERVKSPARSALELLVALAVIVALAILTGAVDLLIVIVAIIVMVMVHELGHLLAAKRGGMKVTQYFVGFGPRLWSIRRGETEYGVKAIPAGGYVKIPGMTNLEEVDPQDEPRAYRNQPFRYRLLVAVAGSAMHFLMAFLLLWGLLAFVGVGNTNQTQIAGFVQLTGVANPAQAGGLHAGDIVVSVNGKPIGGNVDGLAKAIRTNQGRPVTVVVDRAGQRKQLTVTPVDGRTAHEQGVAAPTSSGPDGVLGIDLTNPTQTVNPIHAVGTSVVDLGSVTWQSLRGVANLFSPHQVASRFDQVTSAKAANQAAANGTRAESIVGVVRTADQAAQTGIGNLLVVLITINIFFGVFNLFPMLPLDGGHVVIAIYERIRTRRGGPMYHADAAKMMPFAYILLAFLAVLVVTALIVDLAHPMANPFG